MISLDPFTTVVAGDWHGNSRWAVAAISYAGSRGAQTLVHLGDYGFTFEDHFVDAVDQALAAQDMRLFFVRGNHDDTGYLGRLDRDAEGCGIVSSRVRHLRDGQRLALGEEVAVALGGAASIDRSRRQPGVSWWEDEITSLADIERAIAGGPAQIVLAHDCPAGVDLELDPNFEAIFAHHDPGVLEYCTGNRQRVREAAMQLRPRLWLHGHYHQLKEVSLPHRRGEETLILGLDCDGTSMERNLHWLARKG